LPFSFAILKSLPSTISAVIREPAYLFAPSLSPPWIFLFTEITLMLPRAYKGHRWYHSKFETSYPSERRAVVPFIL
jgi:3-oxo-5-alpha-steroid 4-dehydrogenase 1